MMSLGKGDIISNSNNKNINANSYNEGKLVATHDNMSDILHTLYFIEAQGYTIDTNIIYQENQSAIRLEVNERISSGKKTKHISSRFFFITDKIDKGEVDVEYCPTNNMWCEILNKPKRGALYRLDCSHLMNDLVDYYKEVERKATHPTLLDTKQDDKIEVPPRNQNIPKANLIPVRRIVLGNGLEEVMWELTKVPRRKGFWRTARENVSDERYS